MNYKIFYLSIFILIVSCTNSTKSPELINNSQFYSNKGFALIYNDDLYKKKIIDKKIEERSLIIFNKNLSIETPVKIINLLNEKYLLAKVGTNSNYPSFYNSVISQRIAKELEIDISEPYIKIETINSTNSFIIGKAKTYEEEKTVADKAPVDDISIKNLTDDDSLEIKKESKMNGNFSYIIKFADLYFENSAKMLKKRLIDEFNLSNVYIKKLSKNNFRVYKGPYKSLKIIKIEFDKISDLDFENIEIIKIWKIL